MSSDELVSFRLEGDDAGSDLVRVGDLVAFLQRMMAALSAIDRAINGGETKYFQLSQLSVGSAAGSLRERTDPHARKRSHTLGEVSGKFAELIRMVDTRTVPPWVDDDVLVKYRDLAASLGHVRSAFVGIGQQHVHLDETYRRHLDRIVGQDIVTVGDIVGTLDAVNFHDQRRAFLYPRRGEQRIPCDFSVALRQQVLDSLNRRVRITGELKRRANAERPYQVKIFELSVLPDESDLPLFEDLYGSSTGYPSEIDPVDMIRALRDAD